MDNDESELDSLAKGAARVKFTSKRKGTISDFFNINRLSPRFHADIVAEMANAMSLMEQAGATPILPDGKVSGNAAVRIVENNDLDFLIVSRSGKVAGRRMGESDICIVVNFDSIRWSADYFSVSDETLPTSDTPLHYAALHAFQAFDWTEAPSATLHGHALETEEAAVRLNLPCSPAETLFSTPEDSDALIKLLRAYPYPQHKVFIRKGHGFIILGTGLADTLKTFKKCIQPNI